MKTKKAPSKPGKVPPPPMKKMGATPAERPMEAKRSKPLRTRKI